MKLHTYCTAHKAVQWKRQTEKSRVSGLLMIVIASRPLPVF